LQFQVEGERGSGGLYFLLRLLKAEHRDMELARGCWQSANFEVTVRSGDGPDLLRAAFHKNRGTWDRLSAGADEAGLGISQDGKY
jgi:hypothetical protein